MILIYLSGYNEAVRPEDNLNMKNIPMEEQMVNSTVEMTLQEGGAESRLEGHEELLPICCGLA